MSPAQSKLDSACIGHNKASLSANSSLLVKDASNASTVGHTPNFGPLQSMLHLLIKNTSVVNLDLEGKFRRNNIQLVKVPVPDQLIVRLLKGHLCLFELYLTCTTQCG